MSLPAPQWQFHQVVKILKRLASETVDQDFAAALQSHVDGLAQLADAITPAVLPAMLTPAQSRILAFIHQQIDQKGEAPTRKEIMQAFGFSSPNGAQEHLRALERKGAITLTGEARGIRVNKWTGGDTRPTLTVR